MRVELVLSSGKTAVLDIKRHHSPAITVELSRSLPIDTFGYTKGSWIFVKARLTGGGKGETRDFRRGDLIYDVNQEALGIALSDTPGSNRQIPLGEVKEGIEAIASARGVFSVHLTSGDS